MSYELNFLFILSETDEFYTENYSEVLITQRFQQEGNNALWIYRRNKNIRKAATSVFKVANEIEKFFVLVT